MKKILYFDYWTKGINHFHNFDSALKQEEIHTKLFHLGSIFDQAFDKSLQYENIKGIDCYDISFYKKSIYKIIKEEAPDCVIGLNIHTLIDRAIIIICDHLKIPFIFIGHGYYRSEVVPLAIKLNNDSIKRNIIHKLKRNILFVIPNYLYIKMKLQKSIISGIKQVFKSTINPGKNIMYSTYDKDLHASSMLVYSKSCKDFFLNTRKFPEAMIKIVGNPEHDRMYNKRIAIKPKINYVVYLEEGLVQTGIWTNIEWYKFIEEINDVCLKNEFRLIIKLHPKTSLIKHQIFFSEKGIEVLEDADMKDLIENASCCISHFSSTIIYPLIFKIPVVIPWWGKSKEFMKNYPENVVKYLNSIEEFDSLLKDPKCNMSAVEEYLKFYVGYTNEPATPKVVNEILNVIDN